MEPEEYLRKDLEDFKMKVVGRCVFAAMLFPFVVHWLTVEAEPIYLMPEEGTSKIVILHCRHWLWPETIEHLEARRTDDGTWDWMKQAKNGTWYLAFAPSDETTDSGPQELP